MSALPASDSPRGILDRYPSPSVNNAFKMVWVILHVVVSSKGARVTWSRCRKQREIILECDGRPMIPPPHYLFQPVLKILRQLGRNVSRNPSSIFQFTYTETGDDRSGELVINYGQHSNEDAVAELQEELHTILRARERRQIKKYLARRRLIQRTRRVTVICTLVGVAAITGLIFLLW